MAGEKAGGETVAGTGAVDNLYGAGCPSGFREADRASAPPEPNLTTATPTSGASASAAASTEDSSVMRSASVT
jgi:hypothetical protein